MEWNLCLCKFICQCIFIYACIYTVYGVPSLCYSILYYITVLVGACKNGQLRPVRRTPSVKGRDNEAGHHQQARQHHGSSHAASCGLTLNSTDSGFNLKPNQRRPEIANRSDFLLINCQRPFHCLWWYFHCQHLLVMSAAIMLYYELGFWASLNQTGSRKTVGYSVENVFHISPIKLLLYSFHLTKIRMPPNYAIFFFADVSAFRLESTRFLEKNWVKAFWQMKSGTLDDNG